MKDNISSYQWLTMLTTPFTGILMMSYIKLFVTDTGRGTYVSVFLISGLTFLLLAAVIFLQKRNQYETPFQTATFLLGKKTAWLICAVSAIGFLLLAVECLNIYIYMVKLFFLPETPLFISALLLFLPSAYMAYCGFRSFTHMSTASLCALLLFLVIFCFTKNNYLAANLFPLDDFQLKDIAVSLPFLFLTAPAITASFFLLPLCTDHRRLLTKAALYTAVICVLMLFVYAMGMMYFGETIIKTMILPFYNLSPFFKGNLLERFDILFMLALLPTLSILASFGFSVFTVIQKGLFVKLNAKHYGLMVLFWSALVIFLSLLTFDFLPLWVVYRWCNFGALALCFLFLFIFGAAAIKRRKRIC